MKIFQYFVLGLLLYANSSVNSQAAVELVCTGQSAEAGKKAFAVDCSDRNAVINAIQSAWMAIRKNNIGGSLENMCFDALTSAKDLHPSISFVGISDSFFMRCNMGLEYVN